MITPSSRLSSISVGSQGDRNEAASHIHSPEQREMDCTHVCARHVFSTHTVQNPCSGNGTHSVGESSRLSGHHQDNPTQVCPQPNLI